MVGLPHNKRYLLCIFTITFLYTPNLAFTFHPSPILVPNDSKSNRKKNPLLKQTKNSLSISKTTPTIILKAVTSSSTEKSTKDIFPLSSSCLEGVSQFEQWWETKVKPNTSSSSNTFLKHASFQNGRLRGLKFRNKESQDDVLLEKNNVAVSVPRQYVLYSQLQTKEGDMDWDTNLAVQLLEEYKKGEGSDIYGYCALLSRGNPYSSEVPPPPTAPNALRHWSEDQKQTLQKSKKGIQLLDFQTKQSNKWKMKYDTTTTSSFRNQFSYPHFVWAMEAIHSRAFRGDFGPVIRFGKVPVVTGIVAQIGAFGIGIKTLLSASFDTAMDDGIVLLCMGLIVGLPIVASSILVGNSTDAGVLLPMIDSANHLAEADSKIEFDPFQDGFRLALGESCLDKKDGQVLISYGKNKSDSELLLNYGFLAGVECDFDEGDDYNDYRLKLSNAFVDRNQ